MGKAARFDLGGVEPRAARSQGVDYRSECGETLQRVGAHARSERIAAPEDVAIGVELQDARVVRRGEGPFFGGHGPGAASHVEDDVGLAHQIMAPGQPAVASDDPKGEGVGLGDAPLAGDGGGHESAQGAGELSQLVPGARTHDAGPCYDQRTPAAGQFARDRADLVRAGGDARGGVAAVARIAVYDRGGDRTCLGVEGEGDLASAQAAAGGRPKGRARHAGQVFGGAGGEDAFGDGRKQGGLVEIGQGALAPFGGGDVRGQAHHRHRGLVGFGDPGEDVGGPAAAGALAHPYPAAQAGVGVGHEGGAALVAGEDVTDLAGGGQRFIPRKRRVAAQAEDGADAELFEDAHQGLAAVHGPSRDGKQLSVRFIHAPREELEDL